MANTDIEITPPGGQATGWMLGAGATMQDITPASVRRTDGETRFQTLLTEGFYARTDFSSGVGLEYDRDPQSYASGTADTASDVDVRSPQSLPGGQEPNVNYFLELLFESQGAVYGVWYNGTTWNIYKHSYSGGVWVVGAALATVALTNIPNRVVGFRNSFYICYGTAANVERMPITGGARTVVTPNFQAHWMEPYGSMLFYTIPDATAGKESQILARFDPDNGDLLAVGRIPTTPTDYPRAMLAAYGNLYITMADSLWSFTSQTGNSGVLAGPLDRYQRTPYSGKALEAHEGAVFYGAGRTLRRYTPGGQGRLFYPTLPRHGEEAYEWGEVTGMRSALGKLYLVTVPHTLPVDSGLVINTSVDEYRVLCWNGKGMSVVAWRDKTRVATRSIDQPLVMIAWDGSNSLWVGPQHWYAAGYTDGEVIMRLHPLDAMLTSQVQYAALSLVTPKIDFGLAEVPKALKALKVIATVPTTPAPGVLSVSYTADGGAPVSLVTTDVSTGGRQTFTFMRSDGAYITGKELVFTFGLTVDPFTAAPGGRIHAWYCEPNPVLPLRNGMKVVLRIGTDVLDYKNNRLYPTAASVTSALAVAMGYRSGTEARPLTIKWIDGVTYTVRANTRIVMRMKNRSDGTAAWQVTFDMQEVT